jgi:hypothetical protein
MRSTSTVVPPGGADSAGGGWVGAGAGALAHPRVRISGNDRIQREVLMAARFYRRSCVPASLATIDSCGRRLYGYAASVLSSSPNSSSIRLAASGFIPVAWGASAAANSSAVW